MADKQTNTVADWSKAVELLSHWESGRAHLDDLLESTDPGHLRWLVKEVFRQWLCIETVLGSRVRKPPRPKVRQLLRLAVGECLSRPAEVHPKIVHNAGEVAKALALSKAEQSFLNAVIRNCLRDGLKVPGDPLLESHPAWMVNRWTRQYGEEAMRQLLEWNQSVGEITVRAHECPDYAEMTAWEGYFKISPARFREALEDFKQGRIYSQDPFARLPVELLAPVAGEAILDLCAAPGGKTLLIAEALKGDGCLVAVDRPGGRTERLRENLRLRGFENVAVVPAELDALDDGSIPGKTGPGGFDGVLIDVPCSNTGVIQKRPDVKVRLEEGDIRRQAALQVAMIRQAARWVRPGGRLVYSTCSLEDEENNGVVESFLKDHPGWQLITTRMSLPWECHHDGGGAFLLTREIPR